MGYRTLQQSINAAHQFDGSAPTGATTTTNGIEKYAAQNAGGLFDFGQTHVVALKNIEIKFGGQTSWKLELLDADGDLYTLLTGTTDVSLFKILECYLEPGDKLKLTTAGATTAMKARIMIDTQPGT